MAQIFFTNQHNRAGMSGVVSLATALSIPLMMNDQIEFPLRNLIIFIALIVIFKSFSVMRRSEKQNLNWI